jgi:transcriptional regulator with XRE-family HTH domain
MSRPSRESMKGKHLTPAQRAQCVHLFKAGKMTAEDLARRYGKARETIERLLRKSNAKFGEDVHKVEQKIQETLGKALVDEAAEIAQKVRDTNDEHYRMSTMLAKLTWSTLVEARQAKRAVGTTLQDMRALQSAANVLKITREERYAVLGQDREKPPGDQDIPSLVVSELTAEQIEKLRSGGLNIDEEGAAMAIDDVVADLPSDDDEEDNPRVAEGAE